MNPPPRLIEIKFRDEVTMRYSARIEQSHWDVYRADIEAMHTTGLTRGQILECLKAYHFQPSQKQLRTTMDKWNLNRNNWGLTLKQWGEPLRRQLEATEDSESEFEITIDDAQSSPDNPDSEPVPDNEVFTNGPALFAWSSYATHSVPTCDQPALPLFLDAKSEAESIISRQTFATHPSDNSSVRFYRQESRRVHEIHKVERISRQHEMSELARSDDMGDQRLHILLRTLCKYQCHLCGKVGRMSTESDKRCKQCFHKRCTACLQWPRPRQPLEGVSNDVFRAHQWQHGYADDDDDGPENDEEILFGLNLTRRAYEEDDDEPSHHFVR